MNDTNANDTDAPRPKASAPPLSQTGLPDPARLDFSAICADYIHHIRHSRGLSPRTVRSYSDWFSRYRRWLDAQGIGSSVHERFNPQRLRAFLYALSSDGLRPRSIIIAFVALRQVGKWCLEHGLVSENHAYEVKLPKRDSPRRELISQDELRRLMDAVERQSDGRKIARERAMLSVLIYCGPRFQEWLDMKVSHVSLDAGTILIERGKGQKPRLLYPPPECLSAVAEYLAVRPKDCAVDWLWVSGPRRRVGEDMARSMLEDVKSRADMKDHDNIKPHSVRHGFATRLMENGAPLDVISAALGHHTLSVTYRYVHAREKAAEGMRDYSSFSPPHSESRPSVLPPQVNQARARFTRQRRASGRRGTNL